MALLTRLGFRLKKTTLAHQFPYPHEHSRHAAYAVLAGSLFFISSDNLQNLLNRFDSNIKWWAIYGFLLGFFYFFASPFLGKAMAPNYSNFNRWYIAWLLVAAVYHLPSFQSMGVDIKMSLSLFLSIFLASAAVLLAFHLSFLGLWYVGLAARLTGERPEILTILQNSTVISIACCLLYTHCGNAVPVLPPPRSLRHIFDLKEQVCRVWLGPVGSSRDYPTFSKWALYGEAVFEDAIVGTSDFISPVYSLWATFISLYIAHYVVERSTGWALAHASPKPEEQPKVKPKPKKVNRPDFLPMVPWYSGTSADLFKTAFDLIISVTLFLGRFDMRTMQAAMSSAQAKSRGNGFTYKHLASSKDLWFDFMADTGDGGNSTYTIARLLAQPHLTLRFADKYIVLPRSKLLLIGGDLAYPNPCKESYEKRLFLPFEYALQPPTCYHKDRIAVQKPELPPGVPSLKSYDGPQCFCIPGNHDWLDGLDTFMRYICHKSWLGGWLMPQEKSYFSLKLPQGWWIFGLDQGLAEDIDIFQFKYFSTIADEQVGPEDNVIILTHEPSWVLDNYWGHATGKNVTYLVKQHLKGRCRMRMAGDLHNYMHHTASTSSPATPLYEHLVVNGAGGAFLHPTHVFAGFDKLHGAKYECRGVYPPVSVSRKISLSNIVKFRKKNWRFDIVGGLVYFVLVFSLFPQCKIDTVTQQVTFRGHVLQFLRAMSEACLDLLQHSYVSMTGLTIMLFLSVLFVPGRASRRTRMIIGCLHLGAHLFAALVLMLLLELGVDVCVRHKLLGTSGYHTLYDWYQQVGNEHFPDPTGLRRRMEEWTYGFYPACVKYLMAAFDVPEVMAVTRGQICEHGMDALPRYFTLIYYASVFLYYWVFSTPIVSLVFGCYLYISINWFSLHFDEAFSSLRIANYKSFCRCHIRPDGSLEVFSIAVDKVPREWALDPLWEAENATKPVSHLRDHPSLWVPVSPFRDKQCNARIVDHFVVEKLPPKHVLSPKPAPKSSTSSESPGMPPLFPGGRLDHLMGEENDTPANGLNEGHNHSYSI